MTAPRQLPLSRLGHLVPPLIDQAALVALMPLTDDFTWAAKAAWDIARIAARDGRRVALVDLCVEQPALHQIVGGTLASTEGIVDAFEYGVSLNKAAHEVMGVFFIPVGSDTAKAAELYAHPRWRKLQAGFRSEGALMLVFLPPTGLAQLSATPDGVMVLAPEGLPPGFASEVPLLGVVRDRWLPSGPRVSPPPLLAAADAEAPRRGGRLRIALAALFVTALAIGGWALLARAKESAFIAPPPAPPPTSTTSTTLHPPPPPPRADTLAWTVQLAAYTSLDKALAHADRLAADAGVPSLVTPVPQSEHGGVWYRVVAGSYATRAAAGEARADLWHRGIAGEGIGDLLRAPYSFRAPDDASIEGLRRRGLPAVRWSNGVILVGAFEAPEQAAFTKAALQRAGVRANLLPRMGTP